MTTTTDVPHPLPAPLVELIAERFRVLGEPMRIRLLDALREAPATVQELQRGDRRLTAERLQAPRPAAAQRAGEPAARRATSRSMRSPTRACSSCASRSAAVCAASWTSSTRCCQEEATNERDDSAARRQALAPPIEHVLHVGPIGRLGRYTATHFRTVLVGWLLVAARARVLRAAGRDARSRARAGKRAGRSRCRPASWSNATSPASAATA